jgi:hypothetical protein
MGLRSTVRFKEEISNRGDMKKLGVMIFLAGSLSWGQMPASDSATTPAKTGLQVARATPVDGASSSFSGVAAGASGRPIITITGLCENPADQITALDCKTVITEDQLTQVIDALGSPMSKHDRREFALHYADVLVLAAKAGQMGLDKTAEFDEQMKLARIQILSKALNQAIREKASQISDSDIEAFYQQDLPRFEIAELDRVYIPRVQPGSSVSGSGMSDAERDAQTQAADQVRNAEADRLRKRALGGEDFTQLQAAAYRDEGIKSAAPNATVSVRRISLPPDQAFVMDLKPGEISPVLEDPNGFYIYRLERKEMLSLAQAHNEIVEALRTQRIKDATQNVLDGAKTTLAEDYFVH